MDQLGNLGGGLFAQDLAPAAPPVRWGRGVGLGLPIVASFLAKRTHAPNITILLELGVVDPEPIEIGVDGLSDPRIWYRAKAHTRFADMLGSVLHRGLVDVGFLGSLEVDAYGDINSTLLGDPRGKYRRFTGSGGVNDIASCARRTVITIRHEARKLNEAVSFITSPGYIHGCEEREAWIARGPQPGYHRHRRSLTSIRKANGCD